MAVDPEELRSQIQKAHRSLAEAVFFLKTCRPSKLQNAGGIVSAKGATFLSLEKGAESK